MRYELNRPYEFSIKDIIEDNDILKFMVDIEGNLFPVRAYKEQIEDMIPSSVSCRIALDKNKKAYLLQNEAFLFPILYKPDHRYIFEVVEIREQYAVLKDKHGILHAMDFDGTNLSQNEIIVRCVEVIKDNDYKAHLRFYYKEPFSEDKPKETIKTVTEIRIQPNYPPTIFEEDEPEIKPSSGNSSLQIVAPQKDSINVSKKDTIEITTEEVESEVSVITMLNNKDWHQLSIFFDKYLEKAQTRTILNEVATFLENCISGICYWEAVKFLIDYDAHIFLGTIARIDTSHILDIFDAINIDSVDDIIKKTFCIPDKLKYALDLSYNLSGHLTMEQKKFIKSKCITLNTPDAFFTLFKVLHLSPDDVIVYLLSLKENIAAAFTIYQYYLCGKNENRISEKSSYVSLRPSKISELVQIMYNMHSYPFHLCANLINSNILFRESCTTDLKKAVYENGFEGFLIYFKRTKQQKEFADKKRLAGTLSTGDFINELKYITQTDNYYILRSTKFGVYALLDKRLAKEKIIDGSEVTARISKVFYKNGNKVLIVSQKEVPTKYYFPPIIKNSWLLDITFHDSRRGFSKVPVVKKLGFIINIELDPLPNSFDYSKLYKAQIIRRKDFFTYQVKILYTHNTKKHEYLNLVKR